MSLELNEYLENVLSDIGGCGRFQFVFTIVVLGTKATVAWSVLMMTFGGAVPEWSCNWQTEMGEDYMPNSTFPKMCILKNKSSHMLCFPKTLIHPSTL